MKTNKIVSLKLTIISFLAVLVFGYLLLIPQNAFSGWALDSDPYTLILKWKPPHSEEGVDMSDCNKKTERLVKLLSKTKDCQSWEALWFKDMECAVKSGLTPEMIAFCWQYNNNSKNAELFYQTLIKKYSKKQCDYDDYYSYSISCSEFVEEHIERLRFFMDYSKFPSDAEMMINDLFDALKKHDKKKVLSFFAGREKETIDYEPKAPICDIETLINKHMPDTFAVLYRGYEETHPMNPRSKGDKRVPCIQSGYWKGISDAGDPGDQLSFQILEIPPRLGEPSRYYYVIQGGCVEKK